MTNLEKDAIVQKLGKTKEFIENFGKFLNEITELTKVEFMLKKESMKELTEDQFDEQFKLVKNHLDDNASFNGYMFETYGPELAFVKTMVDKNRVVTIIEGDSDLKDEEGNEITAMYYVTGFHWVNRIGYLILENPHTEDFQVTLNW